MNPKVIFLFVLIAAVSAEIDNTNRDKRSFYVSSRLGVAPTYYEASVPAYNYYRTRTLQIPPGVDPVKCPNYPFCGTEAGRLIVPPVAPAASFVPATSRVLAYDSPLRYQWNPTRYAYRYLY
ncbi:uncharacterized protein LOC116350407 [Contarinia nasturtii]|uniref:uncharacterized protein LOC116350407 n=1 Tax=Contarinia nasturtii TaxID=265458 RepID=UPI0012D4982E|nr:uncharacterized protein LOC116350407 [Contarinia nasturtii]